MNWNWGTILPWVILAATVIWLVVTQRQLSAAAELSWRRGEAINRLLDAYTELADEIDLPPAEFVSRLRAALGPLGGDVDAWFAERQQSLEREGRMDSVRRALRRSK